MTEHVYLIRSAVERGVCATIAHVTGIEPHKTLPDVLVIKTTGNDLLLNGRAWLILEKVSRG